MEPPDDFSKIYKNIGILHKALDLQNDVYEMKELIKRVCNEVYPKIDAFILDAKISILRVVSLFTNFKIVLKIDINFYYFKKVRKRF